ncbi:MAG: tRNA uridine-5-carboxymethylaminomethyl(34) synthesis enzyme MnmG [Acidobacteria bacterium]|nr:tRNA uridine-5-carboxymethylaminomethyl(34) synthesis enzyme MnmG [Acidobacteriota bacterium]
MFFDVVVIGAGHAGAEAAWAAANTGASVAICTLTASGIGHMPCNPAIGGTAKGHLVREIDALGGLMGRAIDETGIQFKLLNRSRGPAVWSPRAQADKAAYGAWVRQALEAHPNITFIYGRAARLLRDSGHASGVKLEDGRTLTARAVVITTGTFLNGLIHVGPDQKPAGRAGEPPTVELAESLRSAGFRIGRLKTGTPPRLDRESIDFAAAVDAGVFHVEHGDSEPVPFSFSTTEPRRNQIPCWIVHTNQAIHALVREHIHLSPLFNGQITGIGPRYCPSLEDKVMKFPDKERHQLFLEPEGIESRELYVNGYSMSLPADVQERLVRAVPGLEHAKMLRPGYAIEYDFVQPTELSSSLETRRIPGLFLAGQINGTSGYEEAAGQGLIAGVSAGRKARGQETVQLGRAEAYIGIMIDDLITKGCLEPYRMFTSRAEYRLLLRIDNADLRLTPRGRDWGLVDDERWQRFQDRRARYERNIVSLRRAKVRVASGDRVTADQALKQPEITLATLVKDGHVSVETTSGHAHLDLSSVEVALKFEGYLLRQAQSVERARRQEDRRIPADFPYLRVPGLSTEMVHRLSDVQPSTLGQALRVPGVTPAAVAVVGAYLHRFEHENA